MPGWLGIVSVIATILGSIGVGGMLKTWLDYRRSSKVSDDSAAMALIDQQRVALDRANGRIDRLERQAARKDELHELRMAQLRHRLGNMRMIFEVAIHLMKTSSSDRMPEIIEMIEQMRAKHEREEAEETAAILAVLAAGDRESAEEIEIARMKEAAI